RIYAQKCTTDHRNPQIPAEFVFSRVLIRVHSRPNVFTFPECANKATLDFPYSLSGCRVLLLPNLARAGSPTPRTRMHERTHFSFPLYPTDSLPPNRPGKLHYCDTPNPRPHPRRTMWTAPQSNADPSTPTHPLIRHAPRRRRQDGGLRRMGHAGPVFRPGRR